MSAKGPERTARAIALLRSWQALEREAINTTAEIMEKTDNLLIRQMMEIIRNDSVQHHRVQQFLIDSMTKQAITLAPEDLGEIWSQLEAHDKVERKTIELAKELKDEIPDPVTKVILEYLITDEEKHDKLLEHLDVGRGRHPFAPGRQRLARRSLQVLFESARARGRRGDLGFQRRQVLAQARGLCRRAGGGVQILAGRLALGISKASQRRAQGVQRPTGAGGADGQGQAAGRKAQAGNQDAG